MLISVFHLAFFNSKIDKHQHMHFFIQHSFNMSFVNAQQAKPYNIYKNTKLKLLKTNTAICNIVLNEKVHVLVLSIIKSLCYSNK